MPSSRPIARVGTSISMRDRHPWIRSMDGMSTTPTAEQSRPSVSLPSSYVPADVEGPLYERWTERGYFTADPASDKPAYCIVIPPPNVTGSLHLGHAFQHTL